MEYKSDLNTVISNILGKLSGANLDAMNAEIATSLQASNLRRIHNDGLNVNLTRIGRYSKNELYVNPKNSPKKFVPIGKTGKKVFKSTGKEHKTKYFKNGYGEFRSSIGRESSFVNLQLTGGLKAAYKIKKEGNNSYVIDFWSKKYSDRADNLVEHFGDTPIWGITRNDNKLIDSIVERHMKGV